MVNRLKIHTLKVLETHKAEPLKIEIKQKLDEILAEAELNLSDIHFRA